jgi:D-alanine-D-alanine ligase
MNAITPRAIPEEAKRRLRILFIAKHAKWDSGLHPEDGNHALYHVETREILKGLGLDLRVADSFDELYARPDVDFVFPLLNRGGFLNSEMLAPLLCTRAGLPFLGASPILRGLADDKHLAKLCAAARGLPTAPWAVYRRGAPVEESKLPAPPRAHLGEGDRPPEPQAKEEGGGAQRWVIKPNASSASWAVSDAFDWPGVQSAVLDIHGQGHDAIVEPFLVGSDVEVPVITVDGQPVVMPMMLFEQADPTHLRTYYEKRDLVARAHKYRLVPFDDAQWTPIIAEQTLRVAEDYRPFDYGRFEFRLDRDTGTLNFLEVNLQANLWSEKVFGRSAQRAGLTQSELVETILHESLRRQGLLEATSQSVTPAKAGVQTGRDQGVNTQGSETGKGEWLDAGRSLSRATPQAESKGRHDEEAGSAQ